MSPRRTSPSSRRPRKTRLRVLLWATVVLLLATLGWFAWLYRQIQYTAAIDNAQPADAIAVFGAAEYSGHPSPVLHARLDKAVSLYERGIAPIVVTLGGGQDKDSGHSEGGVGRDYLLANGIPYDHIIAETRSIDTEQQVQLLAEIAKEQHFHSLVVVSDGTHLFRIELLCQRAGLKVYTSPRATVGNISTADAAQRMWHEMLSYTFLRSNLHVSWMHRWLESKLN